MIWFNDPLKRQNSQTRQHLPRRWKLLYHLKEQSLKHSDCHCHLGSNLFFLQTNVLFASLRGRKCCLSLLIYHLKQHDSQTWITNISPPFLFDYHLKQHDSQTVSCKKYGCSPFDYHLKQHDSQTLDLSKNVKKKFDYHLKQHDSQTETNEKRIASEFDYHLKQHDSQTSNSFSIRASCLITI